MTASAGEMVVGWCPGALRPMQSGDGWIVRVRPPAGALTIAQTRALAAAARLRGNGHIDFTQRANMQIRGVRLATLPELLATMDRLGLLDDAPEIEAIRNLTLSPLSGLDPDASLDMRPLARELARGLARSAALAALSPKFGFLLDSGGRMGLEDERSDIRLRAVGSREAPAVALALDVAAGPVWLGAVAPDRAVAAAIVIAEAFLALEPADPRRRVRHLSPEQTETLQRALDDQLQPVAAADIAPHPSRLPPIGAVAVSPACTFAGIGLPFGRIESGDLEHLCTWAEALGAREMRLTPWRALLVPVATADAARRLLAEAAALGLVTRPDDPLRAIEACTGAPDCPRASAEIRALAHRIAQASAGTPLASRVHVSGCLKGCACPQPCELVLLAEGDRVGIIRNGTAGDRPERMLALSELLADPRAVLAEAGAPAHG